MLAGVVAQASVALPVKEALAAVVVVKAIHPMIPAELRKLERQIPAVGVAEE